MCVPIIGLQLGAFVRLGNGEKMRNGTGREIHKGCVKLCAFKRLWAGSSADAFQQINRSVLSANSLISFIS